MKSEVQVKYPNSASLFQFCRKVLDHKFGGIRVIDQDVGQILGFDPADCSHWKKGKKNIRSIQAMKSIADHLGVDEKLIVDVASGEMDDIEAFFEYAGYGKDIIDDEQIEIAKKDFYAKNANTWTREKDGEFRQYFDLNEDKIERIVKEIHQKIEFKEAPLYLPEIMSAYPQLKIKPSETVVKPTLFRTDANESVIEFPVNEKMRPYIRYQIAKEMGRFFLEENGVLIPQELGKYQEIVRDIQSNIFAAKLLSPAHLVKQELSRINTSRDVVSQLADVFWVSKIFMNRRLKSIIESSARI